MGKLRVLSGREVCQILERHGVVEGRRRGSHGVTQRRTATSTITVPIPDHREVTTGTRLDHPPKQHAPERGLA